MSNIAVAELVNPFVGLRAFEETEDYLFFGRGKQIDALMKKLDESRFLAVIGSSGSGKSSLVKSGLLPSIYSGFMTVGSNWRVALMQPGEDPMGYLTKQLAAEGALYRDINNSDIPQESMIEASLRRSENGLLQVYKDAHLPPNEHLLIVVDQFEELFRFSKYEKENKFGKSDAMHFVQILLTAAQQSDYPVYVLLTMRADFLGDCAEFRGLPEAINKGQYLVPRMTREEIREAITGPVAVSGATISQRLVTRLLNDVNNDTDQLPILQHAMMRTWDAWYKRGKLDMPIDFEDYDKIGTMKNSLSQHADEAYNELTTEREQQLCELMFKALTDKAADARGIRRPRSIADLCLLTGAAAQEITDEIEIFRKPGRTFLMPPPHVPLQDDSIIDISHESLMRVWDRLVKWTEEEAQSVDIFKRLCEDAKRELKNTGSLWIEPELGIGLKWKEKFNNKDELIKVWAKPFYTDSEEFNHAIQFLQRSYDRAIAENEKEVLLAKQEQERRETELKREREEEEKQKKDRRKRYYFIIALVVLLLFLGGSMVAYRNVSIERRAATDSAAVAKQQRTIALLAKQEALDSAAVAREQRDSADHYRKIADIKALTATDSAEVAKQQRSLALLAKQAALDSATVLGEERLKALGLLDQSQQQKLNIAFYEYARLIREGPSDENNNVKAFYGSNYFLAYSYHFDQLKDSFTPKRDRNAYDAYNAVQSKLYYNNDLYQRVYENFEKTDGLSEVVTEAKGVSHDFTKELFDIVTAKDRVKVNDGKIKIDTNGHEFLSFCVSKKMKLIFCSTADNFIYVFNSKLEKTATISMGAKVTALDFSDENKRIYFGTESGYIGYIDYERDKKNQPIFENRLESGIASIQLFQYADIEKENSFLLAVPKSSNPRVYQLDHKTLRPEKRLIGNQLPYKKEYGIIKQAAFDDKRKLVLLVTSRGKYWWNPFTYPLLKELKERQKFNPQTEPSKSLINKPDIKKY